MSGSGGSSGAVSHSAYLETVHKDWLDHTGTDTVTSSMTDLINAAQGNSPWTGLAAYDPDTDLADSDAAVAAFAAILAGLNDTVDWDTIYTQAALSIDGALDVNIDADIDAYADVLDDQITTVSLPRFQRGMQDINAVVSSAFVIGQSNIEGFRNRDVAKYASGLRVNRTSLYLEASKQMIQLMLQRITFEESYTKLVIESNRIKIVAKKEEADVNAQIDESDALWDIELFQHGANLIASIGGGVALPKGASTTQSAIGGALSGAGAGGNIAGAAGWNTGWGTAIGGILGLASGLL